MIKMVTNQKGSTIIMFCFFTALHAVSSALTVPNSFDTYCEAGTCAGGNYSKVKLSDYFTVDTLSNLLILGLKADGMPIDIEPVLTSANRAETTDQWTIQNNIPAITLIDDQWRNLYIKINKTQVFAYKVKVQYIESSTNDQKESESFTIAVHPSISAAPICSKIFDTNSQQVTLERYSCSPNCNDNMTYNQYLQKAAGGSFSDSLFNISVQDFGGKNLLRVDNLDKLAAGSEEELRVMAKYMNDYQTWTDEIYSDSFYLARDSQDTTKVTLKNKVGKSLTEYTLNLQIQQNTTSLENYDHSITIVGANKCGEWYQIVEADPSNPSNFNTATKGNNLTSGLQFVNVSSDSTTPSRNINIRVSLLIQASFEFYLRQKNNQGTVLQSQLLKIHVVDPSCGSATLTASTIALQSYFYQSTLNGTIEFDPFESDTLTCNQVEYKVSGSNTVLQDLQYNIEILSTGQVQISFYLSQVMTETSVYLYGRLIGNTQMEVFSNPFKISVLQPSLTPTTINSQTFIVQSETQSLSFEAFTPAPSQAQIPFNSVTSPGQYEVSYKVSSSNTSLEDINWTVVQNTIYVNVSEISLKTLYLYGYLTNFPAVSAFSEPFQINVIQPNLVPPVIASQTFALGNRTANLNVDAFDVSPALNVTYKVSSSNTSLVDVNWNIIFEQGNPQITIQVDVSTALVRIVYLYAQITDYPSFIKYSDPFDITIKSAPTFQEVIQSPVLLDFNTLDSFIFEIPLEPTEDIKLQVSIFNTLEPDIIRFHHYRQVFSTLKSPVLSDFNTLGKYFQP